MAFAAGVFKTLATKRQTAKGVIATATAGTAKYLRRTSSTLDLTKANYTSAEILPSQQTRDMRHGVRAVSGTIAGELSPGTYQTFFEDLMRQLVQPVVTSGAAQTTITAASTGAATGTLTNTTGNFITQGFNIGDIVSISGFTAPATANNNHYAMITALTATVMTLYFLDDVNIVAKAAGDSVIITTVGKKTWCPTSGQLRNYETIEQFYGDVGQSEVFTDCVIVGATITLPPTGMSTVSFDVMGLNIQTGAVQYFTTPAVPTTSTVLAAVNGFLLIGGNTAATITGCTITIKGNHTVPGGVVGTNTNPDIFPGKFEVTGQLTALFVDNTLRDLFINETETLLAVAITTDGSPNPNFNSFVMPRIKFSGATKDDKYDSLTLTLPFTALEQAAQGGAGFPNLDTTLSLQDSLFA